MSVGFELIIIYHEPKVKEVWMHVSFGVHKTEMCANSWALTDSLPLAASALAVDCTCQDDCCLQRLSELKETTTRELKLVDMYSVLTWFNSL